MRLNQEVKVQPAVIFAPLHVQVAEPRIATHRRVVIKQHDTVLRHDLVVRVVDLRVQLELQDFLQVLDRQVLRDMESEE